MKASKEKHNPILNFLGVGWKQREEGKDVPVEEPVFLGTQVELEALVGVDQRTIDLTYHLSRTFGEPVEGTKTVIAPVSGEEKTLKTIEVPTGVIQSSIACLDGQTRLLGTMQVPDEGAGETILVLAKVWLTREMAK